MTKARDLANLISAGNPLSDGAVSVAEVTGAAPLASPTFTGGVSLGDNVKLKLGDGEDFQLFHNGSASYIQDSGTGNLVLQAADSVIMQNAAGDENLFTASQNGAVSLYHDNAIKLATTSTGADVTGLLNTDNLTINGAQGTNGQVLSSTGSGVGWADASSGGSADFVASGTIANGDVVILNANGTVSKITQSTNSSAVTGSTVDVESLSGVGVQRDGMVYDPVNKKIILSYKTKVVVGTVTNSTISFGTAVTPPDCATGGSFAYDPDTGKVVLFYYDTSAGGTISVGTITGNSISFGAATQITSNGISGQSVEYDEGNDKFIVFYRDVGNSNYGTCRVGSVSGTTVSMGSAVVMNSSYSDNFTTVYDTNINRVVVAYRDMGNSIGKVQVVSISGTTPTLTSAVQFYSGSPTSAVAYLHSAFDSSNNRMIIVGLGGSSDDSFAVVATASTSTVSVESHVIFESGIQNDAVIAYDPNVNKLLISYKDTGNSGYGTLVVGTVSGTSITFDNPIVWNSSAQIYNLSIAYNADAKRFVLGYRQISGGEKYATFTYALANAVSTSSVTNSNVIGVAAAAISDTATGSITVNGGINEGQSSLAVGTTYYVADNGTLQTTNNGRKIGKAISATKLLVNSNMSGDEMNAYLGGLV